ncbi:MAG: glycosyltransferase family 2 protein [Anaerolineae bacterium]|nr:glycosyltransferase family 2 protein [Chloroflexota bacterium]
MSDIGIVIVNYNTREDLGRCLDSIAQSLEPPARRVIVVDNCSTDGSQDLVRSAYPWAELIVSARNGGYAYANNLGLRALGFQSKGPVVDTPRHVLLLNPDTILPSDALRNCVTLMDGQENIGVLGPRLVRRDGSLDRACRRSFPTPEVSLYHMIGLARLFPHSPRFGRYNMTFLDEMVETDVDAVVGAFMLIRSVALEQAGLLDERFFMYGEDLDLCYRIKERGWRVHYYPAVTVLHVKGTSSRKNAAQANAAFYDAMKIFYAKHYRDQYPAPVSWAINAGVALLRARATVSNALRPSHRRHVASAK